MSPYDFDASVSRRTALVGLGKASLLGLAGFPACSSDPEPSGTLISPAGADDTSSAVDCVLTPHQAEGPFYLQSNMDRRDITEGKEGIALGINLTIVDATECAPLAGAAVHIWHTDASGVYSGYASVGDFDDDARGETFMRGMQVSDERGQVHFESVYPGWYPGRVPHIHIKVFFENQTSITSQLYFPDDVSRAVFVLAPYDLRAGVFDLSESSDPVLRGDSPDSLRMTLTGDQAGYTASHTIGIAS